MAHRSVLDSKWRVWKWIVGREIKGEEEWRGPEEPLAKISFPLWLNLEDFSRLWRNFRISHTGHIMNTSHKKWITFMQLGASGKDNPFIQRPTGWHCATIPPFLFYVWTPVKRSLRGRGGWCNVRLSNALYEFLKERDFKANVSHTQLVQFGTTTARD